MGHVISLLFLLFNFLFGKVVSFGDVKYANDFFPKESIYRNENHCLQDKMKGRHVNYIRKLMREKNIQAYIICNENANLGVLTDHDRRLQAISGFSGTIGTAVITLEKAALWTDGRTFQSAIDDVDCGWTVYRKGGMDTMSLIDWIYDNVVDVTSVGACPYHMSAVWWSNFQDVFEEKNTRFVPFHQDLIDFVWTESRPSLPASQIYVHPLQFAGETWQSKVKRTLQMMNEQNADVLLLTNLDEIAWLFNLRARDFTFDPYFISFCVIDARRTKISLYLIDHEAKLNKWSDPENLSVYEFLNTSPSGECVPQDCSLDPKNHETTNTCDGKGDASEKSDHLQLCVDVLEYSPTSVKEYLRKLSQEESVRKVWVPWTSNQAFVEDIPKEKLIMKYTPPMVLKAAKNEAEISGLKNSTLRDSVFLATYFAELEERIKEDTLVINEIEAEIRNRRKNELHNNGPSGTSLIGFGPTAEIMVPKLTEDIITGNGVFLCDMGSQYLDGTTDIARNFVYGIPTERHKDIYTRLLMTHINLARKKFAVGSTGRDLESDEIRAPLREIGVDFPHEIGHMVAAHGSIVEGPASISNVTSDWRSDVAMDRHIFDCKSCSKKRSLSAEPDWRDYVLEEAMVFSNEPSFYGKGEFGMRIENTMFITKDECDTPCYSFEQLVYLPYESKLIKHEMLTTEQISWLKDYYDMVEKLVIPELKAKNDTRALRWLKERTHPDLLNSTS
ncbi:xaa-Pro aminopeptidase ApepP-like [Crassostrea virginica]